jgi:hypothetical protein
MLVYGTCNPEGYGDSNYEGLYLTDTDIREMTPRMSGIPVKIEHRGVDVGKVVTAWIHEGRMDVLMEIDDTHIEGAMGKEFVRRGICPELSLGYNVTMSRYLLLFFMVFEICYSQKYCTEAQLDFFMLIRNLLLQQCTKQKYCAEVQPDFSRLPTSAWWSSAWFGRVQGRDARSTCSRSHSCCSHSKSSSNPSIVIVAV